MNTWFLALTFVMGGAPHVVTLDTYSTGGFTKGGCEIAGAMVVAYFEAHATEDKPNGMGSISYRCFQEK